jgi:NADPH:quinone reductase
MTELRNRIVQARRFGDSDGLEVADAPLPTAGRGEVRVRVLASGVEYTDVVMRRHLYPQTMLRRPPFTMGYDVVGEIDQLGEGVGGFQIGDRVADMTVFGSNAAYRTLRADRLARVPPGVDAVEAAALILSWTTAYQLLHRTACVQQGQRVLVQGVAGAVGQALLVLGRLAGLELWGTVRGAHAALVSALGARRRSTTNTKTSRASCRADSTSSSTESAKTAIAARSRRSSPAPCSAPMVTRQMCTDRIACRPS